MHTPNNRQLVSASQKEILRQKRIFAFVLTAIVCSALFLAMLARINHNLTLDEPFTANNVNYTISQMLNLMWDNIQQPLYYLLLRPWRVVFGESEFALRLPSMFYFAGAIVVTGLIAKRIYGFWAGLISSALVAFSSMGLHYGATARPYMLAGFLVTLYFWVALPWVIEKREEQRLFSRRDGLLLLLLGVIGALGLLSHIIFIFVLAAFSIAALFLSWRHAFRFATANLVTGILFLIIWGAYFFRGLTLPSLNAYYRVPDLPDLVFGYGNILGQKKSLIILAFVAILFVMKRGKFLTFFKERSNFFVGLTAILAVLLPVIFSQVKPVYAANRTPIIALPLAAVALGGLLMLFDRRWLAAVPILFLAGASAYDAWSQWFYSERMPFAEQVADVLQEVECGDRIVSVGITEGEVSYYLRRLGAPECVTHEIFPEVIGARPWTLDLATMPLEQRSLLAAEAQSLVQQAVAQGGEEMWIFAPTRFSMAVLTEVLITEVDDSFRLVEERASLGTFNDSLFHFEEAQ